MTEQILAIVLQYGLAGVVIVVLAYGYINKDKKLEESNEKRIAEAREAVKAIEQNTNTVETLTEVLRERGR